MLISDFKRIEGPHINSVNDMFDMKFKYNATRIMEVYEVKKKN